MVSSCMGFARNSVSHSGFWRKGSLPEAGAPKEDGFYRALSAAGRNVGRTVDAAAA